MNKGQPNKWPELDAVSVVSSMLKTEGFLAQTHCLLELIIEEVKGLVRYSTSS